MLAPGRLPLAWLRIASAEAVPLLGVLVTCWVF
jgi:hypothetical protein